MLDPHDVASDADEPTRTGAPSSSAPSRSSEPELEAAQPDRIARFVVLDRLGAGGMGVVYAAWDPNLDRRVAVKRVHPGQARADAQDRLLREAQAMARLSHPNVVSVFDADIHEGAVWIAMEYVHGRTLREWLAAERRAWPDILAMFRGAGEGLAAAHAAGLVHRDFKPDNVLIGSDGRARVADFGLVLPFAGEDASEDIADEPELSSCERSELVTVRESWPPSRAGLRPSDEKLTGAGVILGTPRYMAPEQFLRQTTDARADQFAFCVALYEALYGEPPFPGKRFNEIAIAVVGGHAKPPRETEVPAAVARAVMRGLAREPHDRFVDMRALLRELDPQPAASRGPWLTALLVGSVVIASLVALAGDRGGGAETIDPCASGRSAIAEVWAEPQRRAVADHFAGLELGYADRSFAVVAETLGAWTTAWSDAYGETCVARHEQSAELYDLRMACLARQREQVGAFVELLAEADAELVRAAPERVATLPDLQACADIESLRAVESPSSEQVEPVRAVRDELALVLAWIEAEQLDDVGPALSELRVRADTIGHRPLIAEVANAQAELATRRGEHEQAGAHLLLAHELALATSHESLALETASALIMADDHGEHEQGLALGRRWHVVARGLAQRAGDPPAAELERRLAYGRLLGVYARYDEGLLELRRAAELAVTLYGPDDLRSAKVELALSLTLGDAGLFGEAAPRIDHVVAIYEQRLGPDHPLLVTPLRARANLAQNAGRLADALRDAERMRAIEEATFGPDHPKTISAIEMIAVIHDLGGDHPRAREQFEAVLARTGQRERVVDRLGATTSNSLCFTLLKLGELAEARRTCERALDGAERTFGAAHPIIAIVLENFGLLARAEGRPEQALEFDRRALAICEASVGPDHPYSAYALVGIAESLIALGRVAEAIEPAERARAIRQPLGDPGEIGEAEWLLARALAGSERERASELAASALTRLRTAGPNWKPQADACSAWLAAR